MEMAGNERKSCYGEGEVEMAIQNSPSHKASEEPQWKYWAGNSLIFTDQK